MLPNEYAKNREIFPSRSNVTFSNEKVEKVVKPPQIPVIRKSFTCSGIEEFFILIAQNMPSKKQPEIFTTKVPHGKKLFENNLLMVNLATLPIAPPVAIQNKFFI